MAEATGPILLLAAMRDELAPTLRRIEPRLDAGSVVPCITGMGRDRVLAGLDRSLDVHRPSRVLHVGVAGALRPGVAPVSHIRRVIHADGEAIELPDVGGATLLTVDEPALTLADKRTLFELHHADLVDMETYHVARLLQKREVPLTAIRAVSDAADETILPRAIEWVNKDGHSLPGAAARYLATHPWHVPTVMRMGWRMRRATRQLADSVVIELERLLS